MQHSCTIENASKMLDWIEHRGGIAVWRSVNLSNPGASWSTPALTDGKPTPKPTWQAASEPELVTDASNVEVCEDREVKRFRVAVKRGDSLNFVCTDASTRKIRQAVEKAGDGSYGPSC